MLHDHVVIARLEGKRRLILLLWRRFWRAAQRGSAGAGPRDRHLHLSAERGRWQVPAGDVIPAATTTRSGGSGDSLLNSLLNRIRLGGCRGAFTGLER